MIYRILTAAFIAAVLAAPARADFKLTERADVIYLTDGTEVKGTVIAEGIKAVIVLVKADKKKKANTTKNAYEEKKDDADAAAGDADKEEEDPVESRVIKRSDILRIEKGPDTKPTVEGFMSDPVNGVERTTGRGFREQDPADAGDGKATATKKNNPAKSAKPPRNVNELTVEHLKAMAKMNPNVKQVIDGLGGPAKALKAIKGNPQMSQQVNQMLQGGGANRGRTGRPDSTRPRQPSKDARPRRPNQRGGGNDGPNRRPGQRPERRR